MRISPVEELGDVIHIVQLWVQQRLACSKRRGKRVLSAEGREDSWQGKKESPNPRWAARAYKVIVRQWAQALTALYLLVSTI